MREARKHVAWYMHGLRGAAEFRRMAGELETLSDLDKLLEKVYIENKDVSFDRNGKEDQREAFGTGRQQHFKPRVLRH